MSVEQAPLSLIERVRAALALGESHFREFKSAVQGLSNSKAPRDPKLIRKDIGEALVAFANADGGELLVGVEDDGTVTGVPHPPDLLDSITGAWRSHVHKDTPLQPPRVARVQIDGHVVLYFAVDKGTAYIHLTQDGRCLQRRDRESVPVPSEQIRFERQERLSREYDRQFVDGGDASVLDLAMIERVAEQIAPGMSPEKVLQLLDLGEFSGERLRLRRAAVLLFATDVRHWHPRCEVRILRVAGTELKAGRDYNVVVDKHVVGCVLDLLGNAWEELRPYLVETRLGPEGRFEEQVRYPEDACREALTNAIAHRDYSVEGRAIEVYVFDDRLEVRSPGPLLSTVTVEGLRSLQGVHQSRNTTIARTLRELGYMREMGEGFRRIFHLMRAHDLVEPEISADDQSFTMSLQHRSVFSEEDQRWIEAYEVFNLERQEEKVLLLGRTGQPLTVQQIMDALDLVDTEDYRILILGLQQKGLVRGIPKRRSGTGKRKSPRWTVIQPRDANRYYGEILRGAQLTYRGGRFDAKDFAAIGELLSADTPYIRQQGLRSALVSLGLVDNAGVPQGRLRVLLETSARPDELASPSGVRKRRRHPPTEASSGTATDLHPPQAPGVPKPAALSEDVALASRSEPTKVFVGNLAYETSAGGLRDLFARVGVVVEVNVPRHYRSPGRNRGYGFVVMASSADAKRAREQLEGALLDGRRISLEWGRS